MVWGFRVRDLRVFGALGEGASGLMAFSGGLRSRHTIRAFSVQASGTLRLVGFRIST